MKRKILILLCLLFLSGCRATYEINLADNKITEKLVLIETDQSIFDVTNATGWTVREMFESLMTGEDFSNDSYSVRSLNKENELGVEITSKETSSILSSEALNQCYVVAEMTEEDNVVTIKTGENFKCYEYYENLDEIKVVFTTNHKVISTNADIQENDKYIWNITKDGNKNIEISYDKSVVYNNSIYITIIIIILIIVAIGSTVYLINKKSKQNNEI